MVVLVGPKTYCRKYVDWEVYAGLSGKVGGYCGLVGICLPNNPDYGKTDCNENITPPRLVDNIKSGYAKYYDWTTDANSLKMWIEEAFNNRKLKKDKINNTRLQYQRNKCE